MTFVCYTIGRSGEFGRAVGEAVDEPAERRQRGQLLGSAGGGSCATLLRATAMCALQMIENDSPFTAGCMRTPLRRRRALHAR